MKYNHQQIDYILVQTNASKKKLRGTDDVAIYEQSIFSAIADSPESSNRSNKIPSLKSRCELFPSLPHSTVTRGLKQGKIRRRRIREDPSASYSRVVRKLRGKKVSPQLKEKFLDWME